jgi:amino acid permease
MSGNKDKKGKKSAAAVFVNESGPSLDENVGSGDHLIAGRLPVARGVIILEHQETKLSRALSQRHIQMIALAGAIARSSPTSRNTS